MKKRFSVEFAVLILLMVLSVSCRTAESNANEILKSSIDLASAYASAGQYDKAVNVYDRAYAQLRDYRILYNKAMTLAACKNYSEAVLVCRQGIDSYPMVMAFRTALVSFLETEGKFDECRSEILAMLELDPYNTVQRKHLIELFLQDGDTQQAYEHAQILWNQGIMDAETVSALYQGDEERWGALYMILVREEAIPEQPLQESTQSDEPFSE